MRAHGLLQLVDDKFVASCRQGLWQVDCQNLLFKVVSCNKPDFNKSLLQLDEIDKFVGTC